MKVNCRNCYYGLYSLPKHGLSVCSCDDVKNKITVTDKAGEHIGVKRKDWNDEVPCEYFTPSLQHDDCEVRITHNIDWDCPFCNSHNTSLDVDIHFTEIKTCPKCKRKVAIMGEL